MRSREFTIFVIIFFVLSMLISAVLIHQGYGLPRKFEADYILDSFSILAGTSIQTGKPIIYEWNIATLLRPGTTRMVVKLGITKNVNPGNITIIAYINERKYIANGTQLEITFPRENMFFTARIEIIIHPSRQAVMLYPIVDVNLKVIG